MCQHQLKAKLKPEHILTEGSYKHYISQNWIYKTKWKMILAWIRLISTPPSPLAKYHHRPCSTIFQHKYYATCQEQDHQAQGVQKDEDTLSFGDLIMVIMKYCDCHNWEGCLYFRCLEWAVPTAVSGGILWRRWRWYLSRFYSDGEVCFNYTVHIA